MEQKTSFEFDLDTAVEEISEGRFAAAITDRWDTPNGPDGGYIMAIAAAALSEVMPHPDPITSTVHFMRPPVIGPATIETELIRAGRRLATGTARLIQNDKPVLTLLSTFGNLSAAAGRTHLDNQPPQMPPPEECADPMDYFPETLRLTIGDRFKVRLPEVPGWLRGAPSGKAETSFWLSFADGRLPDTLSMLLVADAAPPVIFELSEVGSVTLELTVHVRARPESEWLICRKWTKHLVGGYFEEDGEIWDANGNLIAQSRQLALLP